MFAGLKRAARAIFVDDVRIRRDGQGLRIVLESGPPSLESPLKRAHQEADAQRERQVALIRAQLADVFATVPGLRQHLGNLAQVDQALAEQGLYFLDSMPVPSLRAALRQFEDAVLNWSPEGLAYLRSRMAVALRERSRREGEGAHDVGDASALPVVREIDTGGDTSDDDEAALLAAYGAAAAAQPSERT